MALKEVPTNVTYVRWAEVPVDDTLCGFYMEMKLSEKYKNQIHYIETPEGKRFGLNGNANLDRAMEQIKQGWYCEITYKGMTKMESGKYAGGDCHQFHIAYDDERVHPLHSGDTSARKEVEYKNSQTTPSAPTLVKPASAPEPQPVVAQPAPVANALATTGTAPVASGTSTVSTAPKRSIF